MKVQYVAKLGTPDDLRQVDSESDREIMITASDLYEAHKFAMDKCRGTEEVLALSLNKKLVFDYKTGFIKK